MKILIDKYIYNSPALACLLSATLVTSGLVACNGGETFETDDAELTADEMLESDEAEQEVDDEAMESTIRLSLEHEGERIDVEMTRVDDGPYQATRVVTHPDGSFGYEAFEVTEQDLGLFVPESPTDTTIPGIASIEYDETVAGEGIRGVMVTEDGHEIRFEMNGNQFRVAPVVVIAVAASIVLGVIAVICGVATVTSITTCANQGKCWRYGIEEGICSGECTSC